jgi:hypothetical protein
MKASSRFWPVGDGSRYTALCPCDGLIDVGHGGGPRPSLVLVPWENHGGVAGGVATTVSTIIAILAATTTVAAVDVPMPVVVAVITIVGAATVVLARRTAFCWSRTPSKQQLDRKCPGGFPPSWYPSGCGGWRRWCQRMTKKRSWSLWLRKTWIHGPTS